jgi:hypothetical protein
MRDVYEWWVTGYVTGAGRALSAGGVGLAATDWSGIAGWVHKYCEDHPLDDLEKAAAALVAELKTRASKQ